MRYYTEIVPMPELVCVGARSARHSPTSSERAPIILHSFSGRGGENDINDAMTFQTPPPQKKRKAEVL